MKTLFRTPVFCIFALAFVLPLFAQAQGRGGGGVGKLNPKKIDRMAERLKLSEDVTERIKKLVFDHKKQQIELKAQARDAQLELRRQLDQDAPDRNGIMSQIEGLGSHQIKMRKLRVGLLLDIRSLLTADQRDGLKKLLRRGKRDKKNRFGRKRGKRRVNGNRQNGPRNKYPDGSDDEGGSHF